MDRKLFFSYIQNMQTNNPDMIGFQNSMTKNSWLKPRSIVEMSGGGHVYQDAFDADDRRRQRFEDAAEREIEGIDFADVAEKAYNDLLSGANDLTPVQGAFDGFAHDPDAFHRGEGKYTVKSRFTKTPRESVIVPIDAGVHLGEHLPKGISNMAAEMAHEKFMDALNKHHDYVTAMEAEADARDWHADRQMTHGGGNPPLHESKAFSAAWRRSQVDPYYKRETTETVREIGEQGLIDGIRKMAGRHLKQIGKPGYHPSAHLEGEQAERYQAIMGEIATGKYGHIHVGRILDMIDTIKLHSGQLKPYEAVHSYAAELATQGTIASLTSGAETSVDVAASRTPPEYRGKGSRNVEKVIKGAVKDLRPSRDY